MNFQISTESKLTGITELVNNSRAVKHSDYFYSLENAAIVGEDCILCTSEGYIINESSEYELKDLVKKYYNCVCDLSSAHKMSGEYLSLSGYWSGGFWHWITEYLLKAVIAESEGYKGAYLIPPNKKFCYESLLALGVSASRIIENKLNFSYVEKLYITKSISGSHQLKEHQWLIHKLRKMVFPESIAEKTNQGGNLLYVSRRNPPRGGCVINEDDVINTVKKFNGKIIYMEDLNFQEQIKLDMQSAALISPHGAGMVHCMFMPKKSLIIELFSPIRVMPCMYPVIDALNHDYRMITSHTTSSSPYKFNEEILADTDLLELTLKSYYGKNS